MPISRKTFGTNSVVVFGIKMGVKKSAIRTIFERFGRITKIKTSNAKNGTLRGYIHYEKQASMEKAIASGPIQHAGYNLIIKKAFDKNKNTAKTVKKREESQKERQNIVVKICNCIMCNDEMLQEILKIQRELITHVRNIHNAELKEEIDHKGSTKLLKAARSDLRYIYKKLKNSF